MGRGMPAQHHAIFERQLDERRLCDMSRRYSISCLETSVVHPIGMVVSGDITGPGRIAAGTHIEPGIVASNEGKPCHGSVVVVREHCE